MPESVYIRNVYDLVNICQNIAPQNVSELEQRMILLNYIYKKRNIVKTEVMHAPITNRDAFFEKFCVAYLYFRNYKGY